MHISFVVDHERIMEISKMHIHLTGKEPTDAWMRVYLTNRCVDMLGGYDGAGEHFNDNMVHTMRGELAADEIIITDDEIEQIGSGLITV